MNENRYTGVGAAIQGGKRYSRRDALTSIACLALASSSAVAAVAAQPLLDVTKSDAELRHLGSQFENAFAGLKNAMTDQEADIVFDHCRSLVRRICELPATTLEGFLTKLRAMEAYMLDMLPDGSFIMSDPNTTLPAEHVMFSLSRDMVTFRKGAV